MLNKDGSCVVANDNDNQLQEVKDDKEGQFLTCMQVCNKQTRIQRYISTERNALYCIARKVTNSDIQHCYFNDFAVRLDLRIKKDA